jgi:hypothetical protein
LARFSPLWLLLPVQAVLLFWNLGLLPVWTDEIFTLEIAPLPLPEIVSRLARDIHPPLYYFQLHLIDRLAGGASPETFRAVSAVWALLLTALMDRLWFRQWKPAHRWLALLLTALSPCMLLYARMARSYTMQAALAFLAVWAIRRWLKQPGEIRNRALPAVAALVALLYTHYVPGLSILGGFGFVSLHRLGWRRAGAFVAAVLLLYFPWLWVLVYALTRWSAAPDFSSRYFLTGNVFAEQIVKLGFGWTSLSIGESFPSVSLILPAFLLSLLFIAARRLGILHSAAGVAVCVAAALGYIAVSRWVSYPFTPARLLWLLPFLAIGWTAGFDALRPASARWMFVAAVLISHTVSISYYFQRRDFLNPGYSAPLREIAASINSTLQPEDLVLMDAYNTDGFAVARLLRPGAAMVVNQGNESQALLRIAATRNVWVVRNERDISPGRLSTRIEEAACAGRTRAVELWHPYAQWQIIVMRLLRIEGPPTAFYRVTLCRAPG